MTKTLFLALTAVLFSQNSFAKFLPENHLDREDRKFRRDANMTEKEFGDMADAIVDQFKPFADLHGAKLSVEKNWDDSTVNAYATEDGTDWEVHMFGGLARRPEVTQDGFRMVVCHELGHHFGGYPFYQNGNDWAAAEGQADYFATQVCARMIWAKEKNVNATFRKTVSSVVKTKCDAVWDNEADQNICYRIAAGASSLANLLSALGQDPQAPAFDTPDATQVDATIDSHPPAQCRLDTYFDGSLCSIQFDLKTIPGLGDSDGQASVSAESIAANYSCFGNGKLKMGDRPRCWFKSVRTVRNSSLR